MRYKGVICFSAVDWDFLKQRTHYLMAGLAEKGLRVFFVENTGVRCPGLNDMPRVISRLRTAAGQIKNVEVSSNLDIFSPLAIPFPFSIFAITYNKQYFKLKINNYLKKYNLKPSEIIFWTYLATPVVLSIIRDYKWGVTVYDIVSDSKIIQPRLAPYEEQLLKGSDFTFFASITLYDKYYKLAKNPVLFKDGFNLEIVNKNIDIPEIKEMQRPRFIYIGGLNKKLCLDFIIELAKYFQNGSVILVGPRTDDIKIPSLGNIYQFPKQMYVNLAGFLKEADAGLVPYFSDDYSGAMHPAKLNEYLSFGLPIVATATPELKRLSEIWGNGYFYLGNSAEEFVRAADKAIAEDNVKMRQKRLKMALENTWEKRINELNEIIGNIFH
ncbi:glycosyltransferase [Pelotomaculum thermopropionicum SI]|uniref:Glycosyltransferase n=1 Tax=Pelotomaculum thermopropionicum (strain DSM 13744 / JCM 10971 / SI) TaxID=370438 RepID=A5CZ16_PELTS|nr:glycosyltransferase [Pelotomaculum thermopropionicum SI]